MFDPTRSQKYAKIDMIKWWKSSKRFYEPYLLGGAAGTGKTYLLNHMIEEFKIPKYKILVVSYTGQAVSVLRRRGTTAYTIYSKFMEPYYVHKVNDNGDHYKVLDFRPVEDLDYKYDLIIIEEGSFVNDRLAKIIAKHGIPTIYIGDHFQLPPVSGASYFTSEKLNFALEDVMRQLEGSNLLKYLTNLRRGNPIIPSDYRSDVYFLKAQSTTLRTFNRFNAIFKNTDMIITATNKQRQSITDNYRKLYYHTDDPIPVAGERLICRKNRWNMKIDDYPLVNGTIGYNLYDIPMSDINRGKKYLHLDFQPNYIKHDYFNYLQCDLDFLMMPFGDKVIPDYRHYNYIEPAAAITAHLSQGDQYKKVLYVPSWHGDIEYKRRIDYTAASRAIETVFVLGNF